MLQKRPLTFVLFLLRLFSGLIGGIAGTFATFIVYFIMLNFVPGGQEATALSIFVIIMMAFVGTLAANTVTALMVTVMDNEKYSRRKTTLLHVFLFNIILFIVSIPLYMIAASFEIIMSVVALHFLLSAYISAIIMEVIAGTEYALLGIYSSSLAIFFSISIAFVILLFGAPPLVITFGAMPFVWFMLELSGGLCELIYDSYLKLYGVDVLNVRTDVGGDNEIEPEDDGEDEDEDKEE